jgi:hypothetical protein
MDRGGLSPHPFLSVTCFLPLVKIKIFKLRVCDRRINIRSEAKVTSALYNATTARAVDACRLKWPEQVRFSVEFNVTRLNCYQFGGVNARGPGFVSPEPLIPNG